MTKPSLDRERVAFLITAGSEITGGATGGALGLIFGGPLGAAIGGGFGGVVPVLGDFVNRMLSQREKARVGAAATFALLKAKENIDAGRKPRDDGFFATNNSKRSNADEIFEGVLLKAKNEHEEKKVRFLGNAFANIAFTPGFSAAEANYLLHSIENMTYRQLVILSLVGRKAAFGISLKDESYRGEVLAETVSILQECRELDSLGLIFRKEEQNIIVLSQADVIPNRMALSGLGERYYRMMELEEVPEEEIRNLVRFLS